MFVFCGCQNQFNIEWMKYVCFLVVAVGFQTVFEEIFFHHFKTMSVFVSKSSPLFSNGWLIFFLKRLLNWKKGHHLIVNASFLLSKKKFERRVVTYYMEVNYRIIEKYDFLFETIYAPFFSWHFFIQGFTFSTTRSNHHHDDNRKNGPSVWKINWK